MENRCPFVLDTEGRDIRTEAELLRQQGTIARVELPQGVLGWVVVGHDLGMKLLSDPRVSKDPRKHWPDYISGKIGPDWPLASWPAMENMTTAYGEDHQRLRRPVVKAFTPRRVKAMEPYVHKTVNALLDDISAQPAGSVVGLKESYAYKLPATIICDMFGVPAEARADVLRGGEVTTDSSITPEEAAANIAMWTEQFTRFIAAKRAHPGDDLTSALIAEETTGNGLTDGELVGTLFVALGAGSETVMNLITNAVFHLLIEPDQRALVESGQATWDDVIEETLRLESPLNMLPLRYAVEDIEIDGVTIPKGDPILMGYGAIGRDPLVHGDTARTWDLARADKKHLSFGHGNHYCFGAPLARLEARIALPALFDRFPDLALAARPDELEPQGTFIMNGFKELPVTVTTPVGAESR